jgi:hypothetical protein
LQAERHYSAWAMTSRSWCNGGAYKAAGGAGAGERVSGRLLYVNKVYGLGFEFRVAMRLLASLPASEECAGVTSEFVANQ